MWKTPAAMVLACVFVVSSAAAGEPAPAYGEVRTENIKFDDLNLATTAGVDALHKRIQAAANRVCAVSSDHHLDQAVNRVDVRARVTGDILATRSSIVGRRRWSPSSRSRSPSRQSTRT